VVDRNSSGASRIIDNHRRLLVPIALPIGVEEASVLDAVVARLGAIASMICEREP
jgi:hypothetical protein